MTETAPALVILAAGLSRRLGRTKALVELRASEPRTPLAWLLEAGRALGSPDPLVVTGHADAEIAAVLPAGIERIHNPNPEAGRTGSVQLALAARPGRDLCLAPVDVPLVPATVFAALARSWEREGRPARGWLAPFLRNSTARASAKGAGPTREESLSTRPRFGHPVLLGRDLAAELANLHPDAPLYELRHNADPLLGVEVTELEILDDLDTQEDWRALKRRCDGG